MAKLTRVTGKVFGGNAPLNQIGQFGSALAGTPNNTQDVAEIQALDAYSNGWGSAVISSRNFPPIEEVTGVLKTISYQSCYLLQEGIPEYDINTEYSNTSIVKIINGNELIFYISLQNNNIGNPLTDSTYWKKLTFANSDLSNLSGTGQVKFDNKADRVGDNTFSGSNYFDGVLSIPWGTTVRKQNNQLEGGEIIFEKSDNDPSLAHGRIHMDVFNGVFRIYSQPAGIESVQEHFMVDLKNNSTYEKQLMPNYNQGWGISFPYTAPTNGYIRTKSFTTNNDFAAYVNGVEVTYGSGWSYGGASNIFTNIFPVALNDYISTTGSGLQNATFFPLRGVQ